MHGDAAAPHVGVEVEPVDVGIRKRGVVSLVGRATACMPSATSATVRASGPAERPKVRLSSGMRPFAGLEGRDTRPRGGQAHRTADVGPHVDGTETGRGGRSRSGARTADGPLRVPRLRVMPDRLDTPDESMPQSGMVVEPTMTAPCSSRRSTTGESRSGITPAVPATPACAGMPARTKFSFTVTGTPSSGPRCSPAPTGRPRPRHPEHLGGVEVGEGVDLGVAGGDVGEHRLGGIHRGELPRRVPGGEGGAGHLDRGGDGGCARSSRLLHVADGRSRVDENARVLLLGEE